MTSSTTAVVGEAPGWNETRDLRPFVGASGKLLDEALSSVGVSRQKTHVTNAVLCQPPDVGKGNDRGPDTSLVRKAVEHCKPRLDRELKGKKKILALGAIAAQATIGRKVKILRARGFIWERDQRTVYTTVHPAFILRTPSWEPVFATDLQRFATGALPVSKGRVVFIEREEDLKQLDELGTTVGLDIETTRDQPTRAHLLCTGISDGTTSFVVVHALGEHPTRLRIRPRLLNRYLKHRRVITHNGPGFDHIVLARYGVIIPNWEDTLLAHHAIAGHMPQRLDHVVSMYLASEPWKILAKEDEKGGWDPKRIGNKALWQYNARDAQLTVLLWFELQPELKPFIDLYREDKALAIIARGMQETGIRIDPRRRRRLGLRLRYQMASYLGQLRKRSGLRKFNPNRLVDVRKALFKILHAPVLFRTSKTNEASTGAETLQTLSLVQSKAGRFCKLLLDWREAQKTNSVYVEGITPELDGAIHPSWRSWGTVSGRFSCKEPNLMNLPRSAEGVKEMYIARPGHCFVAFDCAQLEPRVAAYASGDTNMIAAVETGDYHAVNAELLFGKLPERGTPEFKRLRYAGKRAGLAINYLAEAETLMRALVEDGMHVDLKMVQAALARLHRHYARYFEWQAENLAFVQEHGYLEAWGGRRRWFGFTPMPTEVANFPIQTGAAFVVNGLTQRLVKIVPGRWKILTQVHDYLKFEVPEGDRDRALKLIRATAEAPVAVAGRKVVFPVEMKEGRRWSEVS